MVIQNHLQSTLLILHLELERTYKGFEKAKTAKTKSYQVLNFMGIYKGDF